MKFPLILIITIIIIIIIIINLLGLNRKKAWLLPRIFYSSKSVYIIHEGYPKNIQQIRFCFLASNAVYLIQCFCFIWVLYASTKVNFWNSTSLCFVYSTFP